MALAQKLAPPEPKPFRPCIEKITSYIKDVYYEKAYAEYMAATLTFKISVDDNPGEKELVFCNFKDEDATDEYLFWLSMCYIKHKRVSGKYFGKAQEIVKNWPDKAFVAGELLCLK